jgi:hypothetical protein
MDLEKFDINLHEKKNLFPKWRRWNFGVHFF